MANVIGLDQTPPQDAGAIIEGEYRYLLWRTWDVSRPRVLWVMLNPSTANAVDDDNTVVCCKRFSKDWRFGSLEVVNLFALRTTDPVNLLTAPDPFGPRNDAFIAAAASRATRIIVAWGGGGVYLQRDCRVLRTLTQLFPLPLDCLGVIHNGCPRHPLRLAGDTKVIPYPGRPGCS